MNLMGNVYFSLFHFLEEVYVEPTLLAVSGERDAAGDSFVIALHVEVMADIGVVVVFFRVAFAACD